MNGGVVKKHYTAGGRRIALRSGGTLAWLLGDHLGSTAVTVSGTAETGEVRYGSNSSWGRRCGYYLPQPWSRPVRYKAFGVTRLTMVY